MYDDRHLFADRMSPLDDPQHLRIGRPLVGASTRACCIPARAAT